MTFFYQVAIFRFFILTKKHLIPLKLFNLEYRIHFKHEFSLHISKMVTLSDKFNFLHHLFLKYSLLNFDKPLFIQYHKMALLVTRRPVIWMYMVLFCEDKSFSKSLFLKIFGNHHVEFTLFFVFKTEGWIIIVVVAVVNFFFHFGGYDS